MRACYNQQVIVNIASFFKKTKDFKALYNEQIQYLFCFNNRKLNFSSYQISNKSETFCFLMTMICFVKNNPSFFSKFIIVQFYVLISFKIRYTTNQINKNRIKIKCLKMDLNH